jgi:glycerol-3-phosphate O-acyltransferase
MTERLPDDSAAPALIVHREATAQERRLVTEWARRNHPGAEVTSSATAAFATRLAGRDLRIVPVRVIWPSPALGKTAGDRLGERLLRLISPGGRPPALVRKALASSDARVVAGEPAALGELRRRWRQRGGSGGDLASFVRGQAELACDRAERLVVGDRYKVPKKVIENIISSTRVRERAAELGAKLGSSTAEVLDGMERCLHEFVTVQSEQAIDAFRMALAPMHAPAWRRDVDTEGLERLRECNRNHALVFLPSHRSYTDPLVLAEALQEHGFPRTHILGGDNMGFWPIGPLGKRAGVIFIRRSFADDAVYKFAMREYLGFLVAKRFNLEWYIEGGRSRTGKLRKPQFGLLNYLVRGLSDGNVDDVILVPTALAYDHMHEVGAIAAEQGGAPKRSEGPRWLADYIARQRRSEGTAFIRFSRPLSLRESLLWAGEGPAQLEKVAFRICAGINQAMPVTRSSLVTFAMLDAGTRALSLPQIRRICEPLLDYLHRRGLAGAVEHLREPAELRKTLDFLVSAGVLACFEGGNEPVFSVAPDKHHTAAYYRNGAVHHLLTRSILELALIARAESGNHAAGEAGDHVAERVWEIALRLRDLLKFEFFFDDKQEFRDEVFAEFDLLDPDWRTKTRSAGGAAAVLEQAHTFFAPRALRSFFDAQYVLARTLASGGDAAFRDTDALVNSCLGIGRQLVLQGEVTQPDSVSKDLYAEAARLADNRGLLAEGTLGGRRALVAELEEVIGWAERASTLDSALLSDVLPRPGAGPVPTERSLV